MRRTLLICRSGRGTLRSWDSKTCTNLLATMPAPPDPDEPDRWLGGDLGWVNLAVNAAGENFSSAQLEAKRRWYAERCKELQSIGTKSAKRRLKQLSGRQAQFPKHTNHCISRRLFAKARRHNLGSALEGLNGISERTKFGRAQRSRHQPARGDLCLAGQCDSVKDRGARGEL